jgi:hypothetical protein
VTSQEYDLKLLITATKGPILMAENSVSEPFSSEMAQTGPTPNVTHPSARNFRFNFILIMLNFAGFLGRCVHMDNVTPSITLLTKGQIATEKRASIINTWYEFPDARLKVGLLLAGLEKTRDKPTAFSPQSILSSPIWWAIYRETRAFPGCFELKSADFLCSPDCVAEREGFEPSIQVLARITV